MFNPYAAVGLLLAMVLAFFGGMHTGKKVERAGWQAEKIEMQQAHLAAMATQAADRDRENKSNQAKARKASEDHEKALATLETKHDAEVAAVKRAGGLRVPARKCPAAAAAAAEGASTGGLDEALAETERLPAAIEDGLFSLVRDADKVVAQCQGLQDWVRDNGFYGP